MSIQDEIPMIKHVEMQQEGPKEQEGLEEQMRSDGPSAAAGKRSGNQPRMEKEGTNNYTNMKGAELQALLNHARSHTVARKLIWSLAF